MGLNFDHATHIIHSNNGGYMNQLECVKLWLRHDLREDQQLKILKEGRVPACESEADSAEIDAALAWLEQPQHHLIAYGDLAYPYLLSMIDHPPPFISVHGHLDVLNEPQLGMVGCRSMTHYGAENAFAFAKALTGLGYNFTPKLFIFKFTSQLIAN